MHRYGDATSRPHRFEDNSKTSAVCSYRQIARILAEREGTRLSQARVGRMCRSAEARLASLLLADPEIRARLRLSSARLQ
ncbi:MAG: hypothetical protein WD042_11075 [Phycisphaeraceae bacterium]